MIRTFLASAALVVLASTASAAPTLKVGDPAPPLKTAKWFKGQAEEKFDPSLVYVVEFWATWCGPCIKNIPHLSELAKKHEGKARIIGMNIWEAEKTDHAKRLEKVGKFVESMGERMNYSVAADDNDGSTAKSWMEAAGEPGIPTAFVIGKDGKIAWIGNPAAGLDKILEDTIQGKLDTKAVAEETALRQKQREERDRVRALYQPVNDLEKAGKPAEAVAALDKLVAEHPELAARSNYTRYNLLRAYDQPAAWQLARKMLEGEFKNDSSGLYRIGRDLTDPPGPKTPDWDLAIAVGERACELTSNKNPSMLSVLAAAHAGKGNLAKAVEVGDLAVKQAKEDPNYLKSSSEYIENSVNGYRRALEKQTAH